MSESVIDARFQRLLKRHKFEEAEEMAKKFALCLDEVRLL